MFRFFLSISIKPVSCFSFTCAAKKVFFDQAVLSVFIDATFLCGMTLLEGQGVEASLRNLQTR